MSITNSLLIEQTKYTPRVIFDVERSVYEISGRAMLEGTMSVHNKVIDWVNKCIDKIQQSICINVKLVYADSKASKMISMLMGELETHYMSGQSIEIRWFYNIYDDDIYALGEQLVKSRKLPIKLIGIVNNKQQ